MKERIMYRRLGEFEVWIEKVFFSYDVVVIDRGRTTTTTLKHLEDAKRMVEQMTKIARRGNA
jgi:ribosomal protein L17